MESQCCSNATESVCPVCLKLVKATRQLDGDEAYLVKECPEHGVFRTVIWRGAPSMAEWRRPKKAVHPELCYGTADKGCPFDCGLCSAHEQQPCSVLLEVTDRCNLSCAVCFADSGKGQAAEPSLERIAWLLERSMAAAGPCNLQLSGGEPTLRDDLPEIVEIARRVGYSFIQLNTNGLRLGADKAYANRLAAMGLSSVFLQFDGVDDDVYRRLRGAAVFARKLQAIRHSGEAGLGVVLVPTLVAGVNTDSIGAIVRQGLELAPTVRGIHFQPFSQFGRFPQGGVGRFTLPELMRCLEDQTGGLLKVADFSPPGGEHAHCSFHGTYIYSADGKLKPFGKVEAEGCCSVEGGGIARTVETVSRRWKLSGPVAVQPATASACCCAKKPEMTRQEGPLTLDDFLRDAATRTFTISAMAFQDAGNLDLERLRSCCISVVSPEGTLVPFCAYNLTSLEGESLYRSRSGSPECPV